MSSHAFHLQRSESNWRDPDLSILDRRRGPVPAAPLALLPKPWRDWIADTERATGAPADYVLQSVLAGVAAVCGAGVRVRVTPAWDEPLVLWQAVVGEPSTGKSVALAPMRRLLDVIEQERRLGDEERRVAHDERSCSCSGAGRQASTMLTGKYRTTRAGWRGRITVTVRPPPRPRATTGDERLPPRRRSRRSAHRATAARRADCRRRRRALSAEAPRDRWRSPRSATA